MRCRRSFKRSYISGFGCIPEAERARSSHAPNSRKSTQATPCRLAPQLDVNAAAYSSSSSSPFSPIDKRSEFSPYQLSTSPPARSNADRF